MVATNCEPLPTLRHVEDWMWIASCTTLLWLFVAFGDCLLLWDHLFVCVLLAMNVYQQHIRICLFFVPCPQKVYHGSC